MRVFLLFLSFALVLSTPARAHMGHLGEIAGHSHWVGVGLILVGGVAAVLLGKGSKKPEAETEGEVTEGEEHAT